MDENLDSTNKQEEVPLEPHQLQGIYRRVIIQTLFDINTYLRDPSGVQMREMGFLHGQEAPEDATFQVASWFAGRDSLLWASTDNEDFVLTCKIAGRDHYQLEDIIYDAVETGEPITIEGKNIAKIYAAYCSK